MTTGAIKGLRNARMRNGAWEGRGHKEPGFGEAGLRRKGSADSSL